MIRRIHLVLPAVLALSAGLAVPAHGYIRRSFVFDDGSTAALNLSNPAAFQFYVNASIVSGMQSSVTGSNVTVFSPGSDPAFAIRAAMATWNSVRTSGARFMPLKTTGKVIDPSDRQNTIAVASTPADLSVLGSALAVTLSNPASFNVGSGPSGDVTDTDIVINPAYTFSTDGSTSYDLQAIVTHELGHALGDNHSGLVGAVMFEFPTLPSHRYLSSDEIAFVSAVYPAQGDAPMGTLTGKVQAQDGSPIQYGLATLTDSASGNVFSSLTDSGGMFSILVPPASYSVHAEPMNSTSLVQPGNLYLPSSLPVSGSFQSTVLGGAGSPALVAVSGGNTSTAPTLTVGAGVSTMQVPYVGQGTAGGTGGKIAVFSPFVATVISSGQSVDLLLLGSGVDGSIAVQVIGQGISVRPGSVRVDPTVTFGGSLAGLPLVRVTLDVAARQNFTLASLFIQNGQNTRVLSGALVLAPPKPTFQSRGVDSAASAKWLGAVSPGGYTTIYTADPKTPTLGPTSGLLVEGYDEYGDIPVSMGGVSVTFDGDPAPLFYVSAGQINVQVPFSVAGKQSSQMVVNYLGSISDPVTVPVVAAQPAFFMLNATDPFAANSDYASNPKVNSAGNPAARGTVISVYGTGVGNLYTVPTGAPAPGPPAGYQSVYSCTLGGKTINVPFAGWTPTTTALAQWSFVIPPDAATGAVSLACTDGVSGAGTQPATIYIK